MQGRLAGAFDFLENTNMTVRAESIITCVTQVMIGDDLVKKKRSKSGKCWTLGILSQRRQENGTGAVKLFENCVPE